MLKAMESKHITVRDDLTSRKRFEISAYVVQYVPDGLAVRAFGNHCHVGNMVKGRAFPNGALSLPFPAPLRRHVIGPVRGLAHNG
jgi:hypothetical protein